MQRLGKALGGIVVWRDGTLLRARLSHRGAPEEPMWGGFSFGEGTLPSSSEHLYFVPVSSGKRSLGCFLVFWKVTLVKAGSKSRNQSTHLLTLWGKSCISRRSLLRAAPPGPAVPGTL